MQRATQNFASDFGANGLNNPISVTVNGGAHSVVVSGVQADRDPSLDPTNVNVYQVEVWDPWYGAPNSWGNHNYYNQFGVSAWVSYTDWTGVTNTSKWWGKTYRSNNGYDPEPQTWPGNYYNVPPLGSHWFGNYITIEQDTIPPSTYDENIALDNLGHPVAHN